MGRQRHPGPGFIGDLVKDHAGGIDLGQCQVVELLGLIAYRYPDLLAFRHLHGEEELHHPAGLVQQIVVAVVLFRDLGLAVGKGALVTLFRQLLSLIEVHQGPYRDAAVDHVLALIASVVPAAGHIQREVTTWPLVALGILLVKAGHLLGAVSCRAGEIGALDILGLDVDAAALLIEEGEGVEFHGVINVITDAERMALLACDLQHQAGGRGGDLTEVGDLHIFPGGGIQAKGRGLAFGDGLTLGIAQDPGERVLTFSGDGRPFQCLAQVADLVDAHAGQIRFLDQGWARERGFTDADGGRCLGAHLELELGLLVRGGGRELDIERLGGAAEGEVLHHVVGVRGAIMLDQGLDVDVALGHGSEMELVGLPLHQAEVGLAQDDVPGIGARLGEGEAAHLVLGVQGAPGRPPAIGSLEAPVGQQFTHRSGRCRGGT
ncbi:hypothetical protein D3C85_613190 [compost metagenome]